MRTFIRGSRLGGGPAAYGELTSYETSNCIGGQVLVTRDLVWESEVDQHWSMADKVRETCATSIDIRCPY